MQEARAGFDVWARMRGRLVVLQFKASNFILKSSGLRRFRLHHDQMNKLRKACSARSRSVLYVFPLIGSTHELSTRRKFLPHTWVLDVSQIPNLGPPLRRDGLPRKSRLHDADVEPGLVYLRSDPVAIPLLQARTLAETGFSASEGLEGLFENFDSFWDFRQLLARNSAAAVIDRTVGIGTRI